MRMFYALGAAALACASPLISMSAPGRYALGGSGRRPSRGSASLNRWTGKPHEHNREIARRLRQNARKAVA